MPWSFGTVGAVAYGLDVSAGISVPEAAGISAGDILLVYAAQRPNAVTGSWSTPSGYSLLATEDSGTDTARLFGKIAVGGEGAVTITSSATNSGGGVMLRYTGGTLAEHASNSALNGDQQNIDTPSLTISEANTLTLVLGRFSWNHATGVSSWPGSATGRVTSASALGSEELSLYIGDNIQTTATDISSGSIVRTDTNTAYGRAMWISLTAGSVAATVIAGPKVRRMFILP